MMSTISEFVQNFRYAFRPNKPWLVARLVQTVLKSYVFRLSPLRYIDFAIDFTCNLRCEHCFATSLKQDNRPKMKINDYARVARECMALGTVNFSFQGGEPLLFHGLGDTITACQPKRNVISVTTNGTLLSKRRLTYLKQLGVDILTVSVDSAIAEEHDKFRGVPGSLEKTMNGIMAALGEGFKVTIGTVVTHETLKSEGIAKLVDLAKKLKVILYFILPVPAGRWMNNKDMFLTIEDLTYINELTLGSPFIRTDFQANMVNYGCGAVKEILYLTPYGDVLPCPFLHISLGNIFEESIVSIRNRALQNPYFADYRHSCLASTDKEFIDCYLSKTFKAKSLPVHFTEVFTPQKKEQ